MTVRIINIKEALSEVAMTILTVESVLALIELALIHYCTVDVVKILYDGFPQQVAIHFSIGRSLV